MSTCKTCMYWYDSGSMNEYRKSTIKHCNRDMDIIPNDDDGSIAVIGSSAADDTDLEGWLETGPNFGCIHYEGKGE